MFARAVINALADFRENLAIGSVRINRSPYARFDFIPEPERGLAYTRSKCPKRRCLGADSDAQLDFISEILALIWSGVAPSGARSSTFLPSGPVIS